MMITYGYLVNFPYNPGLIDDLKAMLPGYARRWMPDTKEWWISEVYFQHFAEYITDAYGLILEQGNRIPDPNIESEPLTDSEKMARWLAKATPKNPKYKKLGNVPVDVADEIVRMKKAGEAMHRITHKNNCSLKVAFEVINMRYKPLILSIRQGQSHLSESTKVVTNEL